jgi:hypothetical protein
MFGPNLGLRWSWTSGFSIRIDTRLRFWQLKYPLSYKQLSPDGSSILPLDGDETDWTTHPSVTFGMGFTF